MADDQSTVVGPGAESAVEPPNDAPEGSGTGEPSGDRQERRDAHVRAERDQLRTDHDRVAAQLAAVRAAEVARRAAEVFRTPSDLDLVATPEQLAELWAEDGTFDEGVWSALADSVLTDREHWRKPPPDVPGGDIGRKPGARGQGTDGAQEAFRSGLRQGR